MRRLVAETSLEPRHLVLPMFVADGIDEPRPISSMPGVVQHTRDSLRRAAAEAVAAGVGGLMLFGVPRDEDKDAAGSVGVAEDGILNVALRDLAKDLGDETVLMADTCLDEFTDHGHCGVLDASGRVDNDATNAQVRGNGCGASGIGRTRGRPQRNDGRSGRRDPRRSGRRRAHRRRRSWPTPPSSRRRSTARSARRWRPACSGDRRTYQQDAGNAREALHEVELDIAEGADIVMVKPAMAYLDVVRAAADISPVPVAAYQVSGEYAMISAAAANGWIDGRAAALETLTSIRRAGADIVLTYWAADVAGWLA